MAKLRDLCTFLLLLFSVLASSLVAIFVWHNFRLFLSVTLAILLLSFPDVCNFILGLVLICVFAVTRAGGVDSISKVQLMSLKYHLWSILKLISRKFSCSECAISEVAYPIINEGGSDAETAEDSEATRETASTVNVLETEKVIQEVLCHGAASKVEAAETHDVDTTKDQNPSDPPYTTTQFKVGMHCEGCKRKIVETLSRMEGVKRLDISMRRQKVAVSGYVDPVKVFTKLKRTGKNVELWSEEADKVRECEAHDRLPQNPASEEEKLLEHSEPPDGSCSSGTCIHKHDHLTNEDEKGHIKFDMGDCPVEPLAMEAEDHEEPIILGTIKLKRYASLDIVDVTRHNPDIHDPSSELYRNIIRERLPRLPLAGKLNRNEESRALDALSNESYQKGLRSAYRRETLQNSSDLDRRLHKYKYSPYRPGRTSAMVHRSALANLQKREEDEYKTDISDTSEDEAQQLYAVMSTKKGLMKFVPVDSSSMAPVVGQPPLPTKTINKLPKPSKYNAERVQSTAYIQPSQAYHDHYYADSNSWSSNDRDHYAECNSWTSNKRDNEYAKSISRNHILQI